MKKEILELREVVTKLVPLLTGKGLIVTQRGTRAYVAVNTKTQKPERVNIPNISDNADESFICAIQGFIDHEVAHVLITNWDDYLVKGSGPAIERLQTMINIIEDTMIERVIVRDFFPGSRRNIHDLRVHFIEKITKPAVAQAKNEKEVFHYILVPMMRALAGHDEFIAYMDEAKLWTNKYVVELKAAIKPETLKLLPKMDKTAQCRKVAEEIDQIMYPPIKPPVVSAVSPAQGFEKGGDEITIEGENFERILKVIIGSKAVSWRVDSSALAAARSGSMGAAISGPSGKVIIATTPAHHAGKVDVVVINEAGRGTLAQGFEFLVAPPAPAPTPQDEDEDQDQDDDAPGAESDDADGDDKTESKQSQDKPEKKADKGDGDGERDHEDSDEDADADEDADGAAGDEDEDGDKGDEDEKDQGGEDDEDSASSDDEEGEDEDDGAGAGDEEEEEESGSADSDAGEDGEDDGDKASSSSAGGAGDDETEESGSGGEDEDDDAEGSSGGRDDEEEDSDQDGSGGEDDEGGKHSLSFNDRDHEATQADEAEAPKDPTGGGVGDGSGHSSVFDDLDDDAFKEADISAQVSVLITQEAIASIGASDYTVYTRELDRIEPLRYSDAMPAEWVPELDETARQMVGRMQKDIERMLAAQANVLRTAGHRSGRLHAPNLHRLMTGDSRIFNRREETVSKDTAVMLLNDNSGSMGGQKLYTAMVASYALSQTLERVKIPNEVLGFTTTNWNGVPSSITEAMNEEIMKTGVRFSRTLPIVMPIYKAFDERVDATVKKRFAYMARKQEGIMGNIDGESLEYAAMRLLPRREKRKVMIVLSDGHPVNAENADGHLYKTVRDLTKIGIEMIGIGINDDAVKDFYPNHIVLRDVADLPGMVMGELKRILS